MCANVNCNTYAINSEIFSIYVSKLPTKTWNGPNSWMLVKKAGILQLTTNVHIKKRYERSNQHTKLVC